MALKKVEHILTLPYVQRIAHIHLMVGQLALLLPLGRMILSKMLLQLIKVLFMPFIIKMALHPLQVLQLTTEEVHLAR
jgi:hypothetical protein